MKILLAVHHFPPRYSAGAELQAYRTAAALTERGHAVQIVCVESITDKKAERLTWWDDTYCGLPVRRLSFDLEATPDPFRFEYDNLWIGEHLRQLMVDYQPDLFHLYGGYLITPRPLLVAKELGIPTFVSLLEFWFLCRRLTMMRTNGDISTLPLNPADCARCIAEERRRFRLTGQIAPRLALQYWNKESARTAQMAHRISFLLESLNKADTVISQSRFVGDMHIAAGLERSRLIFCRQGQLFPPLQDTNPVKSPSAKLRIGYIGQLARHKGVHLLVDAVRQLASPDWELMIYGNLTAQPEYVAHLRRTAGGDPRIQFAGTFDRARLTAVMQGLDVVVVPSLWYENSPNVIFEAFAHRTPVIATELGGMAELVEHGRNGLLFPSGDVNALAMQLQQILENPDLAKQLARGIPAVRTLDEEVDELEAIYASKVGTATTSYLDRAR